MDTIESLRERVAELETERDAIFGVTVAQEETITVLMERVKELEAKLALQAEG